MYNGDCARKERLVDFGFRLPSAMDNRPQKEEEFKQITGQTIYVSATPAQYEFDVSAVVAEQVILTDRSRRSRDGDPPDQWTG